MPVKNSGKNSSQPHRVVATSLVVVKRMTSRGLEVPGEDRANPRYSKCCTPSMTRGKFTGREQGKGLKESIRALSAYARTNAAKRFTWMRISLRNSMNEWPLGCCESPDRGSMLPDWPAAYVDIEPFSVGWSTGVRFFWHATCSVPECHLARSEGRL